MTDLRDADARTSRRGVLRLLALAPAALAGCAAAGAKGAAAGKPGAEAAPARPAAAFPPAALAAIRSFAVPPETEPAAVFRAAPSRPGEPR